MNTNSYDCLLNEDFVSQVTQLLARRLREINVYCEIHPYQNLNESLLSQLSPKAIILSGGPDSVTRDGSPRAHSAIFDIGVPLLGICYGQQVMMMQLGGEVKSGVGTAEFGKAVVERKKSSDLIKGWFVDQKEQVWMSHGDHVSIFPDDFILSASTESAPIAAMEHKDKPYYALQFHPEVTHTNKGQKIIENFVIEICKSEKKWKLDD